MLVGSEMGMGSSSSIANQLRKWDFCVGAAQGSNFALR